MTNHHFFQPQVIYTRLKDVFDEDGNKDNEDFSPQNLVKSFTLKKVMSSNENKIKNNLPEEKKKYINKEVVESWIEAIKSSN